MYLNKLKSKRFVAMVMTFLLSFSTCFAAVPNSFNTGSGTNEKTFFFANGNSITIKERSDSEPGALITWEESGETKEIVVGPKTDIFGGAHDDDTPMATHVIMEGGIVNAIYGGGLHKSNVTEALIEIKAGTINYQVSGGGAAALTKACGCDNANWYDGNPEESPCKVLKSTIVIEDGAIFNGQDTYGYSLLYGGGQGISYTGETTININGGKFLDTYVTAGGANGYTGIANLNINSGEFGTVVQGINRGNMNEINMNISGGNFNNLYIGGETLDASVNGIYEKAIANISGDNIVIKSLLPGSNGKSVENDCSKVEISLGANVMPENITTKEKAEVLFGTSGEFSMFEVLEVKLDKEAVDLKKGESVNLVATVNAGVAIEDKSVIWKSENPEIATVSSGEVKAISVGETIITAKSKADETKLATCIVKVTSNTTSGGSTSGSVDDEKDENQNDDNNNTEIEDKWENPFDDIKEDAWYYNSVKYVKENGIFKGMSSSIFGADINMTRGMAVEVLYRISKDEVTEKSSFDDVSEDAYYANAASWAYQNEIVEGVGNNKFEPDREITREEFVMMLCRYVKFKGQDTKAEIELDKYEDREEISEKALDAFNWAIKSEIIKGISDTEIAPKKLATRAEVATILMRLCE